MRIGIAGLGRMGSAIAERLMEVAHDLIVWNRSREKVQPLLALGASAASTPAELAAQADAVITILTDAGALDAVYRGPAGLLSRDIGRKLVIEMSTVQPDTEMTLAE